MGVTAKTVNVCLRYNPTINFSDQFIFSVAIDLNGESFTIRFNNLKIKLPDRTIVRFTANLIPGPARLSSTDGRMGAFCRWYIQAPVDVDLRGGKA
jgi:hypothetical protein